LRRRIALQGVATHGNLPWRGALSCVQHAQCTFREDKLMQPLVGVIMGSKSDWEVMSHCAKTLETLGIGHEVRILSAHRTPVQAHEYVSTAQQRGLQVIIAAAGGAAHLAGVS